MPPTRRTRTAATTDEAVAVLQDAVAEAKAEAAAEPPAAEVAPGLPLAQKALLAAAADEFAKQVAGRAAELKAEVAAGLTAVYRQTGVKGAAEAKTPDGKQIAKYSLSESKDKATVSDPADFAVWVEEHFPSEVTYPPTVRSSFTDAVLKAAVLDTATGEVRWAHPKTGELVLVPGLRAVPGGTITGASVRFATDGREIVAGLFAGQSLGELLAGPTAPADGKVVDGQVVDPGAAA